MKVLLINGSPHAKGCTYTALMEAGGALEKNGIETELFQLGTGAVHGCIACGKCRERGTCVFEDDALAKLYPLVEEANGYIVGSPVYYSGPNGALCAVLDRLFYSHGQYLSGKPAAAVLSCRRGGATASFDRLNKYFSINQMPIVTSQYWNAVHGSSPEDVRQDLEGMQIMRTLGNNMAYLLKTLAGSDVPKPEREPGIQTNFIR
ncbi:MAG: flavodoxin family protein [Oscillospiraceae bacterium]|jgi:multimeric flavodoxin WrbA